MNINRGSQLFPHRASCPMWDIAVKYICCLVILVTQNASTRKNPQFVLLKIYWTRKMKSEVYGICQTSNGKIKKRRERRK